VANPGGCCRGCALIAGLYVASTNIRVRADEMITAIAKQGPFKRRQLDLRLSFQRLCHQPKLQAHPLTGIGLGGYAMPMKNTS